MEHNGKANNEEIGRVWRSVVPLTCSDLAGLLAERFNLDSFLFVRGVSGISDIERFQPTDASDWISDWSEGQVFSAKSEIRWRKAGENCKALFLTEQVTVPEGWLQIGEYEAVEPSTKNDQGFLLWGTRQDEDGAWWEARIPRKLKYPTRSSAPRLRYVLYRDKASSAVQWVRLKEVL